MAKNLTVVLLLIGLAAVAAFAADGNSPANGQEAAPPTKPAHGEQSFTVGVQGKVSTLGIGADIAFPVTRRTDIRAGVNAFNYGRTFHKDSVDYKGTVGLVSVHAVYDIFPFGGNFHLSPGIMLYNGNNVDARVVTPANGVFTLNGVDYRSDPANPLTGTGKVSINSVGPVFLVGFGNLIPRNSRHFTFSVEGGFTYQGSPSTKLNFGGNVCDPSGAFCRSVAADPTVQSNIQAEQSKINKDLDPIRFYPIVSVGFGYKF